MAGRLVFSHRSDCPCPVRAVLHLLVCPDGTAHQRPGQGRLVGHLLRLGQDIPVRRLDNTGRRRMEATQVPILQKKESLTEPIIRYIDVNFGPLTMLFLLEKLSYNK